MTLTAYHKKDLVDSLYRSFFSFGQFLKNCSVTFSLFWHEPSHGTNQLPKAGFDLIALKVIFQNGKGLNLSLFSNFNIYCPFIQN